MLRATKQLPVTLSVRQSVSLFLSPYVRRRVSVRLYPSVVVCTYDHVYPRVHMRMLPLFPAEGKSFATKIFFPADGVVYNKAPSSDGTEMFYQLVTGDNSTTIVTSGNC